MGSFKSHAALYWVLLVFTVSVAGFLYLANQEDPVAQTIIEATHFRDEKSIADAIVSNLRTPNQNQFFWIGLEPEKIEHAALAKALVDKFKTQATFQKIIVDEELKLNKEMLNALGHTDTIAVKENLYLLGEKLAELETKNIPYILISASIYTTPILKKNPYNILKEKFNLRPVTLSLAHLPVNSTDEKNMLFGCRTDDRTGTSDWGCAVVSKARMARKKFDSNNNSNWFGLMDLSSENLYMVLLNKK